MSGKTAACECCCREFDKGQWNNAEEEGQLVQVLRALEQEQIYNTNESAERAHRLGSQTSESLYGEGGLQEGSAYGSEEDEGSERAARRQARTSMGKISVQLLELGTNLTEEHAHYPVSSKSHYGGS